MDSFNVLEEHIDLSGNHILEASAGTGKTFAIQHLVARMLIEKEIPIEEILVVTFTRAATRELKERIKEVLLECVVELKKDSSQYKYPYLNNVDPQKAIRLLEYALLDYHNAAIFTIHGFCFRMLQEYAFEGDLSFDTQGNDKVPSHDKIRAIIKDFFRVAITPENYVAEQINIVMTKYQYEINNLVDGLLRVIEKGYTISAPEDFKNLLLEFCCVFKELQKAYPDIDLIEEFTSSAPLYKGMMLKGQIKPVLLGAAESLLVLWKQDALTKGDFNLCIGELSPIILGFDPENRSKRTKGSPTAFINDLYNQLSPIISQARSFENIFACMAYDCQQMVLETMDREEILSPDQILKTMKLNLSKESFVENVCKHFKAALIDEFQDTDPIQWDIFQKLFLEKNRNTCLYLVGDPKQSIYSFRNADIYTYLNACEMIGNDARCSLNVNYRSQPSLVDSLNKLFTSAKDFITLPGRQTIIPYERVLSPDGAQKKDFSDTEASLQFAVVRAEISSQKDFIDIEDRYFLPFIVQEIQKVHLNDGIAFDDMAVLVRDRYQAERLREFLRKYNIPSTLRRNSSLATSPALQAIKMVLMATLDPRDVGQIRLALGSPIIDWTSQDIQTLDEQSLFERVVVRFYELRQKLFEGGFAAFWGSLLDSSWHGHDEGTVLEHVVSKEFYNELQQSAELLMEVNDSRNLIDTINMWQTKPDDDSLKIRLEDTTGVNILTLHISKGLQFDVVFTLGLINRTKVQEVLFPCHQDGKVVLKPKDITSHDYTEYCQEIDAEKMRQLYVSMTRAKYRLYVPAIIDESHSINLGEASPMELFIQKLGGERAFQSEWSVVNLNDMTFNLIKLQEKAFKTIYKPQKIVIHSDNKAICSFSSLAKPKRHENVDLITPPHDFNATTKTPHSLPSGHETGTLLHDLCEHIRILPEYLPQRTKGTLFEPWNDVLAEIVYNAYQTPLGSFALDDVDPSLMRYEMEFTYSSNTIGFYKGFIDLFFLHDNKYYILDWKSNWLGPTNQYYHKDNIHQAMEEHDYYLQAKIYSEALSRYLGITEEIPFEGCFGGVYYLFLRGIDLDHGILHFNPMEVCTCQ